MTEQAADARLALLEAAGRVCMRQGTADFTVRSVAEEAGVTPALVHYYFGGKEGLYEALLARTARDLIARVRGLVDRAAPAAASAASVDSLAAILDVFLEALREQPWLPAIVVREVLGERAPFRDEFVRSYASQMAELVPALIRRGIGEGDLRADLDPELAFLSFFGMTLFPFLARPVVQRVLGIEYDEDFLRRFSAHTRRLFVEGAGA